MTNCVSCVPFEYLQSTFSTIYVQSYEVAGPWLYQLLFAGVTLTMVYQLIIALVRPGKFSVEEFVSNFALWTIIGGVLMSSHLWWTFFYALGDTGPWLGAQVIAQFADYEITYPGILGLLEGVENGYYNKVKDAIAIWTVDVSFFSKAANWVAGFLLGLIFLYISYQMISGILNSYFKIVAIGVLSPFIVFFMAFEQTRTFSVASIRVLIAATMELFLASILTATLLFLFQQMTNQVDLNQPLSYIEAGGQYLVLLMTGIVMIKAYSVFMEVVGMITLTFGSSARSLLGGIMRKFLG